MFISATAISSQNVGNLTLYGPDQLDSQVSRSFLDCLRNTGVEYNIYVDEDGTTVVVPTANRDVDFDGEDRALLKCIMDVNHRMKVAAESSEYYQREHESAVPSRSTTHEWLSEQDALGKTPIGTRPAKTHLTGNFSGGAAATGNGISIRWRRRIELMALSLRYWTYASDYTG